MVWSGFMLGAIVDRLLSLRSYTGTIKVFPNMGATVEYRGANKVLAKGFAGKSSLFRVAPPPTGGNRIERHFFHGSSYRQERRPGPVHGQRMTL